VYEITRADSKLHSHCQCFRVAGCGWVCSSDIQNLICEFGKIRFVGYNSCVIRNRYPVGGLYGISGVRFSYKFNAVVFPRVDYYRPAALLREDSVVKFIFHFNFAVLVAGYAICDNDLFPNPDVKTLGRACDSHNLSIGIYIFHYDIY
jgi:hypothetical protein